MLSRSSGAESIEFLRSFKLSSRAVFLPFPIIEFFYLPLHLLLMSIIQQHVKFNLIRLQSRNGINSFAIKLHGEWCCPFVFSHYRRLSVPTNRKISNLFLVISRRLNFYSWILNLVICCFSFCPYLPHASFQFSWL